MMVNLPMWCIVGALWHTHLSKSRGNVSKIVDFYGLEVSDNLDKKHGAGDQDYCNKRAKNNVLGMLTLHGGLA